MKEVSVLFFFLFSLKVVAKQPEDINSFAKYSEQASIKFHDDIHPFIIQHYQDYLGRYAPKAAENLYTSKLYLSPKIEKIKVRTLDYYKENHHISFQFLVDIPAFIKKKYESGILKIWKWLYTMDSSELESIGKDKLQSVNMAMAASEALSRPQDTKESRNLNQLLSEIRDGAFDHGMQDCYKVHVFDADIINAFNIGCNIFFSKKMYDFLDGDSDLIRAVLAHEMSHGDAGHGIKTLGALIESGVKNSFKLLMEELVWLTSGGRREFLDNILNEGLENIIMKDFGSSAIDVEIEADQRAALILNKSGYSAQALIEFLYYYEKNKPKKENNESTKDSIRKYPTFEKRIDAIKKVMLF